MLLLARIAAKMSLHVLFSKYSASPVSRFVATAVKRIGEFWKVSKSIGRMRRPISSNRKSKLKISWCRSRLLTPRYRRSLTKPMLMRAVRPGCREM